MCAILVRDFRKGGVSSKILGRVKYVCNFRKGIY